MSRSLITKAQPKQHRYNWCGDKSATQLVYKGVIVARISYDDGRMAAALTLEHGRPYYKVVAFHPVDGILVATNFDTIEHAQEWGKTYCKEGREEAMKPQWLKKVDDRVDPVKDALNTERALEAVRFGPTMAQREENPDVDEEEEDDEG